MVRVPRVFAAGAAIGIFIGLVAAAIFSAPADDPKAGGGPRGGGFSRGGAAPAITTAIVEAASVGRTINAIGSGRAVKSVTLVSEATGLVEAAPARAGSQVKAGDIVLKLDDEQQRIALAKARADYPIAKANADRYRALYEEDSASRMEADAAFNAYKATEADLRSAEYALRQRTIRAPFDGAVGLIDIEAGDYVRAGDIVTTIDDLSALIIEFAVPQEEATAVRKGQRVDAVLAGASGDAISGAVTAIDSRVDSLSRTLRIEATFEPAAGEILPGATYAVTTTNEGAAALSAPGLAVQWDRTGAFVWKLSEDGAAIRAAVVILQRRDEAAIIEGAVEAGDVIIVEGADRVRPGMSFPAARDVSSRGETAASGAP